MRNRKLTLLSGSNHVRSQDKERVQRQPHQELDESVHDGHADQPGIHEGVGGEGHDGDALALKYDQPAQREEKAQRTKRQRAAHKYRQVRYGTEKKNRLFKQRHMNKKRS